MSGLKDPDLQAYTGSQSHQDFAYNFDQLVSLACSSLALALLSFIALLLIRRRLPYDEQTLVILLDGCGCRCA